MSVTPVSDSKTWQAPRPRPRPDGLTPIIMSRWVTPSKTSETSETSHQSETSDDIENPSKKRIKVCELPYTPYAYDQKCEMFDVKPFDPEAERVKEARETCDILKRY